MYAVLYRIGKSKGPKLQFLVDFTLSKFMFNQCKESKFEKLWEKVNGIFQIKGLFIFGSLCNFSNLTAIHCFSGKMEREVFYYMKHDSASMPYNDDEEFESELVQLCHYEQPEVSTISRHVPTYLLFHLFALLGQDDTDESNKHL